MNDSQTIDLLKGLVIDGVDKARSGHPGGAMSSMDFAYILFTEYLRFDPQDSKWPGRDRFILSAGHESMLQYALLYAIGWLNSDDLRRFRQLHSRTPGHPENFMTPGVECTTGPLGQGCAMSVGFALAASHMAARLGEGLFDNRTWVLMGDGDMQECVSLGAASLAGHLRLGKLIWYYDKNSQQISGSIDRAYSDDEAKVFSGFGWRVLTVDGHDHAALRQAMTSACASDERPTLIIGRSTMAKGAASMEGSHETHGAPLPAAEREATKKRLGVPEGESFYWPAEAAQQFQRHFGSLETEAAAWRKAYQQASARPGGEAKFAGFFTAPKAAELPALAWPVGQGLATRNAFGQILEEWAEHIPNLIGGSADLEPSNMTGPFAKKVGDFSPTNRAGRNLCFGVREFPMSAICNGMALYGGLIPFDATFLSFADYSRPALRLGVIQGARVIHEFTHDSFYLGEDGPTHQPIEHLMSLRAMPKMYLMRPADALETEVLFRKALTLDGPASFCLTRQKVPVLTAERQWIEDASRGAWIVEKSAKPDLVIFASGSELSLARAAASELKKAAPHISAVQVVSVPCWELFFEQDEAYREEILAWHCKRRVSIEAGVTLGWERFVGARGLMIGVDHYGASAPAEDLEQAYGFTPEAVVARILEHRF